MASAKLPVTKMLWLADGAWGFELASTPTLRVEHLPDGRGNASGAPVNHKLKIITGNERYELGGPIRRHFV